MHILLENAFFPKFFDLIEQSRLVLNQDLLSRFYPFLSVLLSQQKTLLLCPEAIEHGLLRLQNGPICHDQLVDIVTDQLGLHKFGPQAVLGLKVAPKSCEVAHNLEVLALSFGVFVEDSVLLADFVIVNFR
jgi:hypothetical protein